MDAESSRSAWPLPFLAKGASSELFGAGDRQVLKLFHDSVSEEMIAREMAASVHAGACGVPTAAAIARDDRGGRRGIRYPRLDGVTLAEWIRQNPMRAGRLIDAMAAIQAAIHAKPGGALRTLKSVLSTDISYGPSPGHVQVAALAYLESLPDGDLLTHGDFHLDNIMVTSSGMKVIDWSKAASGHPAADAVRSEMLMRFGVGPTGPVINLWRDWAAGRFTGRYCEEAGETPDLLSQWRPVVALAWLRARQARRTAAFMRYLNNALQLAGLPRVES